MSRSTTSAATDDSDLSRIIAPLDVDVLRLAYFNASAVLPIWLVRQWRKHRPATSQSTWAEHRLPSPILNSFLHASMVVPALWGWFRPPLGVSLLAVLRKRSHPEWGRLEGPR